MKYSWSISLYRQFGIIPGGNDLQPILKANKLLTDITEENIPAYKAFHLEVLLKLLKHDHPKDKKKEYLETLDKLDKNDQESTIFTGK